MSERVAIVDLGSNAARFVLARVRRGVEFRVLREERVQTRLAGGGPGALPRAAVRETLTALRQFLSDVGEGMPPRVLAVASAAVRDAANGGAFVDAVRRQTGVELRVLTGEEEARLGAIAALWSLRVERGVIFDLGGGSLQLSTVRDAAARPLASVPMGAVLTTLRFLRHDPPWPAELDALRRQVRAALRAPLADTARDGQLLGIGGTARTLARMALRARAAGREGWAHRVRVRRAEVSMLLERLARLPVRDRPRVPGLKAERADTIVGGLVVIEELMALGGWDALAIAPHGVRHGLLIRETFPEVDRG